MIKLTEIQIKDYIQEPNRCPWCRSDNIESPSSENEHDGQTMIANVYCNYCHEEWKEVYTLTSIKEIEP